MLRDVLLSKVGGTGAEKPLLKGGGPRRFVLWGVVVLAWGLLLSLPSLAEQVGLGWERGASGADGPVVQVALEGEPELDQIDSGAVRVDLVAVATNDGDVEQDVRVRTVVNEGQSTQVADDASRALAPGLAVRIPVSVHISCRVRSRVAVEVTRPNAPAAIVHVWINAARPGVPQEGLTCPQR